MSTNGNAKPDGRFAADRLAKVQLSGLRRARFDVDILVYSGHTFERLAPHLHAFDG